MSQKKSTNRNVYQQANGNWANKRQGASRASTVHRTQAEAQKAARGMMNKPGCGGELTTSGRDGRFRSKDTINKSDPYPPKG